MPEPALAGPGGKTSWQCQTSVRAQDPTGSASESPLLAVAALSASGTFFVPKFLPPSTPECSEMLSLHFMQAPKPVQQRLIKIADQVLLTTLPSNPTLSRHELL